MKSEIDAKVTADGTGLILRVAVDLGRPDPDQLRAIVATVHDLLGGVHQAVAWAHRGWPAAAPHPHAAVPLPAATSGQIQPMADPYEQAAAVEAASDLERSERSYAAAQAFAAAAADQQQEQVQAATDAGAGKPPSTPPAAVLTPRGPRQPGKKRKFTPAEKTAAIDLARQLGTDRAAEKQLDLPTGTLIRWRKAGHASKPAASGLTFDRSHPVDHDAVRRSQAGAV